MIFDTLANLSKRSNEKEKVSAEDICEVLVELEKRGFLNFSYELITNIEGENVDPRIAILKHVIKEILCQTGKDYNQDAINESIYRLNFYRKSGYLPDEYNCGVSSSSSFSSSISSSSCSSISFSSSHSSISNSSSSSSSSSYEHPDWGIYKVFIQNYDGFDCTGIVIDSHEDCAWIFDPLDPPSCYNGLKTTILSGPYFDINDCLTGSSSSSSSSSSEEISPYAIIDDGIYVFDEGELLIDS